MLFWETAVGKGGWLQGGFSMNVCTASSETSCMCMPCVSYVAKDAKTPATAGSTDVGDVLTQLS